MTNPLIKYLIFFLGFTSITTFAQNTFKVTNTSAIGYLEYLPKGYETNSDKYPVVIFLHGLGERGPVSNDYNRLKAGIGPVEKLGPPKYVKQGKDFPFILISPQLKSNNGGWPTWYVLEVLEYCKTYLRIDERRIYLTGLSLGGGGTWNTAQDNPKLFAAIAPVCGSQNSPAKACLLAAENLPVWGFHGNKDHTVGMSRTVNMIDAINNCNNKPNPLAKLSIYDGVAHNAWDKAYQIDHSVHTPNVYEWMLSYSNTVNGSNRIPIANAGADQIIQSSSIIISGSGSDSDGSINAYQWSKISGPSATLSNQYTARLSISNLSVGVYVFRLKVTDNRGDSDSDYIRVTVRSSTSNVLPVVNAGADKTITLPTNSTSISGTASDADGNIVNYEWAEISGSRVSLSGTSTATLNVSGLTSGAYIFRLTVRDNAGGVKTDDITVTVTTSSTNSAPVADAGADREIKLPTSKVTLFGLASDIDGKIVSCNWTKVSGGSCSFSKSRELRPTISNFVSGKYIFRLTVTDDDGAVRSDEVTYVFNNPPIANAGNDLKITLPTNTIILTGSGTDSDGRIVKYIWTKHSGPAVNLSNAGTTKIALNELVKGTYVFKLTVVDDIGFQGIDYKTVTVTTRANSRLLADNKYEEVTNDSLGSVEQSLSLHEDAEFDLNAEPTETQDYLAIIFDQNGKKVFEGRWSADKYNIVFTTPGLYIYQIFKNGIRNTGKVYIK